jgi:hypothetical protein
MWRRLGLSRVVALAGIWIATGVGIATDGGNAWVSVFAFLSTGAVVYSMMSRSAIGNGASIAAVWGLVGAIMAAYGSEGSWISVFAFLTAAAVANSGGRYERGLAAAIWWAIAGTLMLATGQLYWLSAFAFVLSVVPMGRSWFRLPRRFEWDLAAEDEHDEVAS